jgi:hypothetical protein
MRRRAVSAIVQQVSVAFSTMPELPLTGFEKKADLIRMMQELSA